jgi:Amt family ammonium transporter
MFIVFFAIKKVIGLRVSDAEQLEGLDIGEHGNVAYGGFVFESTGPSAVISEAKNGNSGS